MDFSSPSATDMLVIMPPGVQQEASDIFELCEQTPAVGDYATHVCKALLEAIHEHDVSQARFSATWKRLKQIVTEAKAFDFDKQGMAAAITYTIDSRSKYNRELKYSTFVLGELLEDLDTIQAILRVRNNITNIPPAPHANRYFARQRIVYMALKNQFDKYRKKMNSSRNFDIPGDKFGLVPFEDIVLSEDGQTMIWNEEIDDWDLLEDIHPCRSMPGSNWGKFFYDLTPGEFYMKEKRPQIEYSHASPAKRLLDSLQTTHFLANSGRAEGPGTVSHNKLSALIASFFTVSDFFLFKPANHLGHELLVS